MEAQSRLEILDREECLRLLAEHDFGRLTLNLRSEGSIRAATRGGGYRREAPLGADPRLDRFGALHRRHRRQPRRPFELKPDGRDG